MKGFFRWFKSGAKIKRWVVLVLVGIVLVCYGISTLLNGKTLDTIDVIRIAASFVSGFTLSIIAIIHMQKRMLEILVEESDTRKSKNNVNSLIFNKKIYNQGPKVVVIGGGSGLDTVLRGLKHYTDNITAIVTVSDYGEIPSDSRRALATLPLNDIKESLEALAYDEETMTKLLEYRFENGRLDGLSFSDIYFLGMNQAFGNFSKSIENSIGVLNMTGRVLPVTQEPIQICAELDDGTIIESRQRIPEEVGKTNKKISRVFINPTNTTPAPGVLDAIKDADAIVIGPGSLYTNVIPNLLIRGVAKTIKDSKAMKIYISNIMTEFGQTDEYTLSDHLKTIQTYLGEGIINYCIYDTGEIVPEYVHKYNDEGSDVVLADTTKAKQLGVKLIQRNLSIIEDEAIRHDSDVIASTIIQLICDELAFADMENNSQYMKLNSQLRESKREIRKRQRKERKFKKSGRKQFERRDPEVKSKFSNKYVDRIKSIKESEKKTRNKHDREENEKLFSNITENIDRLSK